MGDNGCNAIATIGGWRKQPMDGVCFEWRHSVLPSTRTTERGNTCFPVKRFVKGERFLIFIVFFYPCESGGGYEDSCLIAINLNKDLLKIIEV